MKHLLTLGLLFFGVWNVQAQVVTSDPAFPTETSEITITFNASLGSKGLENFTGDIYAHTGVVTDLSNGGWKYVTHGWDAFDGKPKLTRDAQNPNLYTLQIGNPRTFYKVPAGEKILKLAFVFRSGPGVTPTKEGKDEGNKDIFLNLVEGGAVTVQYTNPAKAFEFKDGGSSIVFQGIGNAPDLNSLTLTLKRGSDVLATANNDTINFTLTDIGTGSHTVMLIGTNGSNADTAFYAYTVRSATEEQARPAGIEDGITKNADGSVTFSLFAPYKNTVYVIGDFNNWTPSDAYKMKRHQVRADSVHYWLTVSGLDANMEYGFQYLVDETIRTGDPYSTRVLNAGDDPWIPATTYPNLKKYPTGKTEGWVSVFRVNEPVYQWKSTNYQRRPAHEVIAYELLIRDFVAAQNYQTLTDTLKYLKRLGITAVKLMPVAEFDGNESWGYNPAYHMALDKYYGTREAFKRFVDSCHANNIAVVLDVVFNHATGSSPLLALWWNSATNQAADNNPYAYVSARHPFNVFHDLKHNSTATNYWMKKVLKYWQNEFKIDGFRFDLSKGHYIDNTTDVGVWNQYNNWRVNHWKDNYNFLNANSANTYVILEHLANDEEERALAEHGMILWGKMTHEYNEASMGWHEGSKSDFRRVFHVNRGFNKMGVMGYMESHDEDRLMVKNLAYGNSTNAQHNVKNLAVALQRMQAAGAMFFTVPGPKMIWQFGELGYDISIFTNENGQYPPGGYQGDATDTRYRVAKKPIKWEYRADPDRYKLYRHWAAQMKLRDTESIFRDPLTAVYFNTAGAFKTIRLELNGEQVVIVANFGVTQLPGEAGYNKTGTWYDWASGNAFQVESTSQNASLAPGTYAIYSTKQFAKPDLESTVSTEDNSVAGTSRVFRLNPAYPNPFNPSTTVSFEMARAGEVTIEVLDLLGRRVATLVNGSAMSAGTHTMSWNASGLGSGVYLIRMQTAGRAFVQKVTLMK
jgi:1,4-alpha-glucan branching enzyme